MTPLRQRPAYRVWRVALAVAATLPRYLWLLVRGRVPRFAAGPEAWSRAHSAAAERLYALGIELAGLFVKVAQVVGARADVLPEPFIAKLARFHDDVPPRSFEELQPVVEREIGAPIAEVFERVEALPLAAASLAQVHPAELRDGSAVVLKIQYPEIARLTHVDIRSLRRVAWLVARLQKRVDVRALVDEVARFVTLELDFEREARSTERIAKTFDGHPDVRVPRVYQRWSRGHLLVLERLEGVKVTDVAALRAAGHEPADVARRIARIYCAMIFEHGFFQGDPHPGNLLVLPDGRIGLLDFGLCKELPAGFSGRLAALIFGALRGDAAAALCAAGELGFSVENLDPETMRTLLRILMGQTPVDAQILEALDRNPVARIPPDFPLIARTLVLLNGLSHVLAPGRHLIQQELLSTLATYARKAASAR